MGQPPIIYERRGRRIDVNLAARVLHTGSQEAFGTITDISFYGVRMKCRGLRLERGAFVSIALPHYGMVRARVAWSRGGDLGAVFMRPVDIRTFLLDPGSSTERGLARLCALPPEDQTN